MGLMRRRKIFWFRAFPLLCVILFLRIPLHPQEKDLDELLKLSLEELAEVKVVTALKKPQRLYDVPASVRVITAAQIEERGYFTLEEALSGLPGTQFRNILGLNSYVFIRGVPSQNNLILVLVDGIQINELNSGGFYGGGQYNLSNVERIEVVYGPASAVYGTNAVSGIVNIITKNPKEIKGGRGHAGILFGNFNTRLFDFGYGFYNKKTDFGFRVSGMAKTTEKADLRGPKGDYNWTGDMENFEDDYSFDVKMTYKDFTYGITVQNKRSSAATYYRSVGTPYRDRGTYWNILFLNTYLKHLYTISKKWSLLSQLYYRNATVLNDSVLVVTDAGQTGYYRPNNLAGIESMLNFTPDKKFSLTGGMVFENENLASGYSNTDSNSPYERPPRPPKPPMQNNTLLSIYLQGQYCLFKGMEFTAGARFDNSSFYGRVLTPRLGLVYNRHRLTAKLLYTEAFRAPKPWDYKDGLGNDHLNPEEMTSVELCAAFRFSKHFNAGLSVYKNTLHGILTKEYTGPDWRWINKGKVNTGGVEMELQYAKGKIKSYFNYTYNHSQFDNGDPVPEIAKHGANIGISTAFTKNIRLDLRGNYLGKRKNVKIVTSTGSEYVDAAFVFHSTLSFLNLSFLNLKKFDLLLVVKNLFDAEYYHTSNRPPDRYRQPQRTVMLNLKYKF